MCKSDRCFSRVTYVEIRLVIFYTDSPSYAASQQVWAYFWETARVYCRLSEGNVGLLELCEGSVKNRLEM